MALMHKLLAVLIVISLLLSIIRRKEWVLWTVLGLVGLWYVIRFCADVFWWGRDKEKW